jgi:hypothetical protein
VAEWILKIRTNYMSLKITLALITHRLKIRNGKKNTPLQWKPKESRDGYVYI